MSGNVPAIRFAGFTEPWEQRKLGDMGTAYGGLTGKSKEDFGHGAAWFVPYTNVFDNPVGDSSRLERVEIDPSQNVVRGGDALFTVSSETPEEVGMSCVWPSDLDNLYLNSFCFGYRQDGSFDPGYLAYMLRADSFRSKVEMLAQGISRFNISKGKVMEIEVPVPDKGEQALIGRLFLNLDSLITLHQRKHDQLATLKKSLLEKMFPKPGSDVPELRFAGFTEPWEQRKFGDLYRPTSEKNDLTFGRDRIISVANMHFSTEVYVTDDDYLRTYNVMRLGDIAFEGNRSGRFAHGRFVENTIGDGIVSHVFKVFRPRTDYDLNYWKYAIHNEATMRDALTRATKASTMMHELVSADFLEQITYAPSLPEQRQIGALFARLDSLITLHQRKRDQLATLKKSLLEKMFV
jgi:type I restriction enzyme S subunit